MPLLNLGTYTKDKLIVNLDFEKGNVKDKREIRHFTGDRDFNMAERFYYSTQTQHIFFKLIIQVTRKIEFLH